MTKEKKTIDIGSDAFIRDREQVVIPLPGGENMTLYVRRLGYLEATDLWARVKANGNTGLVELVAASVEDDSGNRFNQDEVSLLRPEIVQPLIQAVMRVNKLTSDDPAGN